MSSKTADGKARSFYMGAGCAVRYLSLIALDDHFESKQVIDTL